MNSNILKEKSNQQIYHKRHYCKFCKRKRNEPMMVEVYYKLLKKSHWVCKEHVSTLADIVEINSTGTQPVLVELFSGSGHISEIARSRGFQTITIDNQKKFNADICIDILNLRRSHLPGNVDVIWASIPCTTYSTLSLAHHWDKINIGYRKYYYVPKTKQAIEALKILSATIDLIKKINPIYFFIENPRGALRHFPHLSFVPIRKTVSYADYGFDYYKPTDIWTNCKSFRPIHITSSIGKEFDSNLMDLPNAYERSLVPSQLINYVIDCVQESLAPSGF